MLNRTNIKGYKELKAERSEFKQNTLEVINQILDDIDDVANIEECFEIRTELESVHLMCNISDNRIGIIISINTKSDLALIELDKNEAIKDIAIMSPEDAAKKINQFIHQNSPSVATENYSCPEDIFNKLESLYDNTSLIICHKNILIQTISDMISAESLKTDAVKEEIINCLKNKIHKEFDSISSLESKVIEEEKELKQYSYSTDIKSEVDLIIDVIDILKDWMDTIDIIIQFKDDQLKISKMNTYNQKECSIEKLEKMIKSANDKLAAIGIQIDELMK